MPSAVRLEGRLDRDALGRSLNEIVRRHEALRTTFGDDDGEPVQVIAPTLALQLPLLDLVGLEAAGREVEACGNSPAKRRARPSTSRAGRSSAHGCCASATRSTSCS